MRSYFKFSYLVFKVEGIVRPNDPESRCETSQGIVTVARTTSHYRESGGVSDHPQV